jgi:signal transduction histidine kinase
MSSGIFGRFLSALAWRVLSIPIFPKIMGIGILTAILFGGVTIYQTRAGTSRVLYQVLERRILSTADILANIIEKPVSKGDISSVLQHLGQAKKIFPEISYIIVKYPDGRVMTSTFEKGVPSDLLPKFPSPCPPDCGIQSYKGPEGPMFEARAPILDGKEGMIQVGFIDKMATQELAAYTGTILWGLALCIAIGAGLALLLTHILTRPIHHLVESANRIREGNFAARAEVYSNDEIGRLAVAFNQMAEALMRYEKEVKAKERARVSLIERTVQAQEEERKSISRELHDHLGQSLLAVLLQVQSGCNHSKLPGSLCQNIENSIRQVIEEVHRFAWSMRPSILDDYGLDSALARHIEEVSKHSGLDIDYNFTGPPGLERLPSRIEVTLFRIAQEAVTNIQKHANASHASVVVLRQLHDITLLVEDDGQGFDPSMIHEKGDRCLGLIGMRERVALLGGSVVIESVPGEGTTIRARIPLDEDPHADTDIDSR